jgi:hypothetical protein
MVNRYNISINYKLKSLQNDPWVQKKDYTVEQNSKHRCGFHMHNWRSGRPSLHFLAPAGTLDSSFQHLIQSKPMVEESLSRLMVAT